MHFLLILARRFSGGTRSKQTFFLAPAAYLSILRREGGHATDSLRCPARDIMTIARQFTWRVRRPTDARVPRRTTEIGKSGVLKIDGETHLPAHPRAGRVEAIGKSEIEGEVLTQLVVTAYLNLELSIGGELKIRGFRAGKLHPELQLRRKASDQGNAAGIDGPASPHAYDSRQRIAGKDEPTVQSQLGLFRQ